MPETKYTADEMMTIAAARMIRNGASCFVGIGLPSAAANLARLTHAPDTVSDLRIGMHRHQADRAAAFHRRWRAFRNRRRRGFHPGDFRVLAARRPHRSRISRRRADRPLRQHQHHRDRRLLQAFGASAGRGRSAGDRGIVQRSADHAAPEQARVYREAGFRHFRRLLHRRRQPRENESSRQRSDGGDHRSRHHDSGPDHQGADA